MSLVDLGKRLLEAAKVGQTDEVRTLMSNGAPFTTDWVGFSIKSLAWYSSKPYAVSMRHTVAFNFINYSKFTYFGAHFVVETCAPK